MTNLRLPSLIQTSADLGIPKESGFAPAGIIAFHENEDGERLSSDGATVEIINLIRPIVAIGRHLVFLALALKTERIDHRPQE